jgi:polyhydroxybutyrate depolymerase
MSIKKMDAPRRARFAARAGVIFGVRLLLGVALAACSSSEPSGAGAGGAGGLGGTPAGGVGGTSSGGMSGGAAGVAGGPTGGASGAGGASGGTGGASGGIGGGGGVGGASGGAGGIGGVDAGDDGGGIDVPFTCPETSTLVPGETNETVMIGSEPRDFILHVPDSYTGDEPMPMIIDWHPLFGSATGQRGGSGYLQIADRDGVIVAWPTGLDNAWNVGPCCTYSREVDDVAFGRAIVELVKSRGCVDPKRVFATGFSMGGGLSHYLACTSADVFAAVVPASFDLLTPDEQTCEPVRPISVLSFRATNDLIVPYEGGASMPPNGAATTIHFEGAEGTMARWAEMNGCTDTPSTLGPESDDCVSHTACEQGVEVGLCTRSNSHTYGDAELGWAFMKRHPMP